MNILKRWLACVLAFALIVGNTLGTANITYADVIGPSMEKIEDITIPHPYSTAGMERFVVNEDVSFSYWNSLTEESDGFDSAVMFDWEESEKENSFNPESKVYETANVGTDNSYAVAGMRFKNAAEVTFDYKTSCEEPVANEETGESLLKDDFIVIVDDKIVLQAGGETDWTSFHYHVNEDGSVSTEEHEIYWIYSKDVSEATGEDCAFLSNVKVDGESYELVEDVDAGISLLNSGEDGTTVEQGETMTVGSRAEEEDITEESASTTQEQGTTTETTAEDTSESTEETTTEAINSDANAGIASVAETADTTTAYAKVKISETEYKYYTDLPSAISYAETIANDNNKVTVELVKSFTLSSNITINKNIILKVPSGVKLLLPHTIGSTEENGNASSGTEASWNNPNTYLKCQMILNGKLDVDGTFVVAGVTGPPKQNAIQGLTCGNYAEIVCNGEISINNNGIAKVYGRVCGDGIMTAYNGAKVYEPLLVADFPGGSIMRATYKNYFPISTIGLNNIQCKLNIKYGAQLIGEAKIYIGSTLMKGHYSASALIVGIANDNALLKLNSEASEVVFKYGINHIKKDLGMMDISMNGGASVGNISLSIKILFTPYNMSTINRDIPMAYNFKVSMKDGIYTIGNSVSLKFMPGSVLTLQENAILNVENGGRLIIYDGLKNAPLGGMQYPSSSTLVGGKLKPAAQFFINNNSKLYVANNSTFVGIAQTTGQGTVETAENAILELEPHTDGVENGSNSNTSKFNIYARYRNGYSTERMARGKKYVAYNGLNSEVKSWNLEKFECITWKAGSTVHGTSANGGTCTCSPGCTVVEYKDSANKPTETKQGAWNLIDIIYTLPEGCEIKVHDEHNKNPLPLGDTYKFKVNILDGYEGTVNGKPTVKVNGSIIQPDTDGWYTIQVTDINNLKEQNVEVSGIKDKDPTATMTMDVNGTKQSIVATDSYKELSLKDTGAEKHTIYITAEDSPNKIPEGNIKYFLSDESVENVSEIKNWETYEDGIPITPDCNIYVYAKITDNAKEPNSVYLSSVNLIIDNKGPVGTISVDGTSTSWTGIDDKNAYFTSAQNVTITQKDVASESTDDIYYVKLNAPVENHESITDWEKYSSPISVGGNNDESCVIYAKFSDGKHTSYASTGVIAVDSTKPEVSILLNDTNVEKDSDIQDEILYLKDNISYQPVITVMDECSGIKSAKYRINKGEWSEDIANIPELKEGTYNIEVIATDNSDNSIELSSKKIVIDTTAPTATITVEGKNTSWSTFEADLEAGTVYYNKDIKVVVSGADGTAGVNDSEVYVVESENAYTNAEDLEEAVTDGKATWNKGNSHTILIEDTDSTKQTDRNVYIYAKVADKAGNITYVSSNGIMMDKTAPTGDIKTGDISVVSAAQSIYSNKIAVDITGQDASSDVAKIDYWVSETVLSDEEGTLVEGHNGHNSTTDAKVSATVKSGKKYYIYAKITDKAGNTTLLSSKQLIVDAIAPTATVTVGKRTDSDIWPKADHPSTVYYNNTYFNAHKIDENLELVLTAKDTDGSGLSEEMSYVISENEITDFANAEWLPYVDKDGERPAFTPGMSQYVYFRVADKADNVTIIPVGKVLLDTVEPTGTVQLKDSNTIWNKLLSTITFGLYSYNDTQEVEVKGQDEHSDIARISYMETANVYSNAANLENAVSNSIETWDVVEATENPYTFTRNVEIKEDDRKTVIYAKLEDKAGNISYISSEGIIMDKTAPAVDVKVDNESVISTGAESEVLYYQAAKTVTISTVENLAPIDKIEYWKVPAIEENPDLTESSKHYAVIQGTSQITENVTINIEKNASYIIYVKVTDKADNVTEVHTKQIIVDTTLPEAEITIGKDSWNDVGLEDESTYYYNDADYNEDGKLEVSFSASDKGGSELTDTIYYIVSKDKLDVSNEQPWQVYDKKNKPVIEENVLQYVYVKVVDYAGNVKYVPTNPILLDTIDPTVQISSSNETWPNESETKVSYYNGDTISLSVEGQDSEGGSGTASIQYRVTKIEDGIAIVEDEEWTDYTANISLSADAKYKVEAKITDNAGNKKIVSSNQIVVDNTDPTAFVVIGKLSSWREFLNTITFGLFFNEKQEVIVSAADSCAGVKEIKYIKSQEALTETSVAAIDENKWESGTKVENEDAITFNVNPDDRFVIYVRVTDNSGNIEYISSNGMVLDATKPSIACEDIGISLSNEDKEVTENNSNSYGTENITASVEDTYLNEIKLYQVTEGGDEVEVNTTIDKIKGTVIIPPSKVHFPYKIKVTDMAGNMTTCTFYYLEPCTVIFDNYDGTKLEELSKKVTYHYGDIVEQPSKTPIKTTDTIRYEFAGWKSDEVEYPLEEGNVTLPKVNKNETTYSAYYNEVEYYVTLPTGQEGKFNVNLNDAKTGWMDKGSVVNFVVEDLDPKNICSFEVKANGDIITAGEEDVYSVTVDKPMNITVTPVSHDYNDETLQKATCTKAGVIKRTCKTEGCDRGEEIIYSAVSGHDFGTTGVVVTEPTCTEEGLIIGECNDCKQYAEEAIPAAGHKYDTDNVEVVTEATCTTSGLTATNCLNCDHIKFDTIKAGHEVVIDEATNATCTAPGFSEGSHCSRCGEIINPQNIIEKQLGHKWGQWETRTDSTCTKEGVQERNCSRCETTETISLPVRSHNYSSVITNPTCTEQGYTTHICTYEDCGHTYKDSYVDAANHSWSDWKTDVATTCTKDGQESRTCSACKEVETRVIASPGHQYTNNNVAPTCTNEGYVLHTCSVCEDEYRTNTVAAKGHSWNTENEDIISNITCTTPGVKVQTCSECTVTRTIVTPANGHSYSDEITVSATCTENGYKEKICSECGDIVQTETEDALGHDKVITTAKAPTCTAIGWEEYETCKREGCNYTTYKEIPATGHTEAIKIGVKPTCEDEGKTEEVYCSTCNMTLQASTVLNATGHVITVDKGRAATCTETGLTEGNHCIVCGKVADPQVTIPALKHDWEPENGKVVIAATCTNAGLRIDTCKRCELSRSVVLDPIKHVYEQTKVVFPTCTQEGYTVTTCRNCGDTQQADIKPALGHDTTPVDAKAPTCTEIGWNAYEICRRDGCTYTTYEEIPPTGHTETVEEGKEATCTEIGLTDKIFCSVCKEVIKAETEIPATGHKITIDKGYEATCTTKGLEDGKHCSVCDDVIQEQKVIEPLGHDWDTVNVSIVNQPTCTNAGLKIETCKRCQVTRTVVMEALGHNYIETVVEPNCTKAGYTVKTCDKCGDVQHENETAALTHDIESHEAQAATCEAIGWDAYETCKREGCGYSTYVEIPATGHTKVTEPAIDPTCTETGLTEKVYCSVCNEVLTAAEEIPAKGHVETTVSGINPTCTEPGKSEGKYCIVCGDVTVLQKEIPALKHAWDTENAKVAVKPTCQESGTNVETCTRCEITRTVVTDPTGHIYGTGVVTAPTCTKDGYTTFTCTNEGCGHTKQENPTEKLGHTETLDEAVAPTCEKDGLTEGSHCSVCNEVLTAQEVIPATKHTLGDWTVETAPTCEKAGEERRYCLNHKCNHYESREIVAIGHNYKTEVTAPTCTEDGYTIYTCQNDNCGKVTKSDVVKANGHKYSAKVKDPTCESDGYTTFTCSICDDTYNDYFKDKTGHTVVTDEGKAATCTDTGLTEGSHCSTCGKVLEGQEITSALEHNFDNGVVVEATCEKDGYTLKTCTRCDYEEKTDTVKAQGHIWCDEAKAHVVTAPTCTTSGMTVFTCDNCSATRTEYPQPYGHNYEKQVTPPTCEEGGYTTYTCSRCQDSYKENEVDALGHDYVEYEGQDATCTAGGWKAYHVCTRCEDENYEAIEATGHSYKENVVEATCTARGYTTFECEHCEHTYTGNYVDATGHQMGDYEVTTAPTCTDKGVETSKCIHCDYEVAREVEKSGHKYSEEVTEPTCTVNGYTTYTCTVCKDSYVDDIVKATGHEEVTDDAVKASCTEDGLTKGSHCTACGSVIVAQEVIKATGHTEKVDHAVDATCEKDGATEGKHCSVCGEILIAQEVIPAFGHTYENSKTIINPTCDTAGLVLETCATCGDTKLGTLEQLQHEYVSQTTEPTCTEDGNTTYICKLCKNSYVDEVTKATGHNYQEEVTEPTCTDKGYTTYVCKVCQDTYKDNEVAAKGHTSVVDEGKDATCTETGLTDGSHCGTCSVVLTEQTIIPAKGHSYEADVVSATCTTAGHTDYECTRCKHSYSSDITKATGHTYVSSVTKEATESQNGILAFKCSGCQASYNRVIPADMNTWLVDRNTDSITINWNNVHPETNENIGYEIWSADQNGTFALQATVDETVNEYTLSGLVPGSEYKVYVKAFSDVAGKRVYGENSNTLTTVTVPAKAGSLKVSKTTVSSFGAVKWTPVANAQGYELYYKTAKASYYKLAQEIRGNIPFGQITGLKANKTYNIKVRAYIYLNGTKVYGEYSDVLVATTKLKTPTIKLTAKSKKITIKWSRITGAEGYKIYRATSKNGKYKWIKTIKGNKKLTYTNTKLKSGKKYYYKVRAYRVIAKKTRYSAYSKAKYKRTK